MAGYIGNRGGVALTEVGTNTVETADIQDGAVTASKLAAGVLVSAFTFYKADGSPDNITITSGEFPFYKADGSQDNIGVS